MKAGVNEQCIGCGLCAAACPAVFVMGDSGTAQGLEFDADMEGLVREAADGCPVNAISIEE